MKLQDAFQSFELAAQKLTCLQEQLRGKVGHLEEELLDANQELEAVLDAVSDGVAVVDRSGDLLRGNAAFRGLQLDDTERRELAQRVGAAGVSRLRRLDDNGTTRDLTIASSPVGDSGDHAVWTIQDVTEIRREEADSGRKSRLEALGRMAAEVAHEVRNPLGGMRLFAALLHDDLELHPNQREMASRILSCIGGLESTVTNLLDFANPGKLRRRPVDLIELVHDVAALLQAACQARRVELRLPPIDRSLVVCADPEGVRQILLNLVGNALNAVGDGGSIEIDVQRTEQSGAAMIVADDGCGIEGDDLGRVFDPFFSKTEGGSGLGLSIVHRIVEEHGGQIGLESREGRGTTVRLSLPATRFDLVGEEFEELESV